MTKKRVRAVLFGPQGSGKGTQGQLLSERFGVPLIGAGDLLRAEIDEQTSLGKLVKQYVEFGMLAPDELVNVIINKQLRSLQLEQGFLLDGYPRNVEQAEALDHWLKLNLAMQIKLTDAESVRRLKGRRQCVSCRTVFHLQDAPPAISGLCSLCGGALKKRQDDEEEPIRQRLVAYHFMTEPLAAYYRQRGTLLAVNGEQPIPLLFEELLRKMAKLGFTA